MDFSFAKEKEQRRLFITHWLKRIFIDDWLMKLFALLITLALWLGVSGLQEPITRPLTKVRLNTLISSEYTITNTPVDEIELVVEGDKRKVNPLRGEDLVVTIDLTDIRAGERTIHLTPQNIEIDLPSGVKVNDIRPDNIAINLEKVEEYDVPVRAEVEGDVARGHEVYNTRVVPEKVRVRGPSSFVNSLNFVTTEKIDITGRRNDFTAQQVPVNVSSPKVSLVNAATVSVTFRIGPKRVESLFFVPYRTDKRSGRASVLLYGASPLLENLIAEDIFVIEDERSEQGLRVVLPESIRGQVEIRNVKFRE